MPSLLVWSLVGCCAVGFVVGRLWAAAIVGLAPLMAAATFVVAPTVDPAVVLPGEVQLSPLDWLLVAPYVALATAIGVQIRRLASRGH